MIGKVNEILCEHHRLGTIPSRDQGGLLTRLSLTFDPPLHVERSDVRWGRGEEHKEANRRWQGRQAFNVYSEVLDRRPDIFLAFVVARPASRCIGFNVTEFLRRYNEAYPDRNFAPLDNDARELLLHTSRKGNFSTNERFQRFLCKIFPPSSSFLTLSLSLSLYLSLPLSISFSLSLTHTLSLPLYLCTSPSLPHRWNVQS